MCVWWWKLVYSIVYVQGSNYRADKNWTLNVKAARARTNCEHKHTEMRVKLSAWRAGEEEGGGESSSITLFTPSEQSNTFCSSTRFYTLTHTHTQYTAVNCGQKPITSYVTIIKMTTIKLALFFYMWRWKKKKCFWLLFFFTETFLAEIQVPAINFFHSGGANLTFQFANQKGASESYTTTILAAARNKSTFC